VGDAVVELTRIAAETGRWAELLRLAEAAQTALSTTHRVEDWIEIVERRLEAARVVGESGTDDGGAGTGPTTRTVTDPVTTEQTVTETQTETVTETETETATETVTVTAPEIP
jgi:hypothetical protein